jgi:hypothetical protein
MQFSLFSLRLHAKFRGSSPTIVQGCQMVCFQTKNSDLGKFWRVLQWKILVYFIAIWSILRPFGIFCGNYIGIFFPVWIFWTKKNLATLQSCLWNPNSLLFQNVLPFGGLCSKLDQGDQIGRPTRDCLLWAVSLK